MERKMVFSSRRAIPKVSWYCTALHSSLTIVTDDPIFIPESDTDSDTDSDLDENLPELEDLLRPQQTGMTTPREWAKRAGNYFLAGTVRAQRS